MLLSFYFVPGFIQTSRDINPSGCLELLRTVKVSTCTCDRGAWNDQCASYSPALVCKQQQVNASLSKNTLECVGPSLTWAFVSTRACAQVLHLLNAKYIPAVKQSALKTNLCDQLTRGAAVTSSQRSWSFLETFNVFLSRCHQACDVTTLSHQISSLFHQ